jgi:hypothetical protein
MCNTSLIVPVRDEFKKKKKKKKKKKRSAQYVSFCFEDNIEIKKSVYNAFIKRTNAISCILQTIV